MIFLNYYYFLAFMIARLHSRKEINEQMGGKDKDMSQASVKKCFFENIFKKKNILFVDADCRFFLARHDKQCNESDDWDE